MDSLTVQAEIAEIEKVNDFVLGKLANFDCDKNILFQIQLAVEEIFVNIASYAYAPQTGPAEVRCEVLADPMRVVLQFLDGGKPFDPLARADADISETGLMNREGGLGILLVKETMDNVAYSYENGKNILTILKKIRG